MPDYADGHHYHLSYTYRGWPEGILLWTFLGRGSGHTAHEDRGWRPNARLRRRTPLPPLLPRLARELGFWSLEASSCDDKAHAGLQLLDHDQMPDYADGHHNHLGYSHQGWQESASCG